MIGYRKKDKKSRKVGVRMEKKWKVVVGVDVSKDSLAVAVFTEKEEFSFDSKNNGKSFEKELSKFVKVSNPSEILVVMENKGVYYLKLYYYLNDRGYSVAIVNPFVIKKFSEKEMKRVENDKVNSKIIAEYGFKEKVKLFTLKDEHRGIIEIKLKNIEVFQKQINTLQKQMLII